MASKTKLYVIEYRVANKLIETLNQEKPTPISVANWFIKRLKKSSHKLGTLKAVSINN